MNVSVNVWYKAERSLVHHELCHTLQENFTGAPSSYIAAMHGGTQQQHDVTRGEHE